MQRRSAPTAEWISNACLLRFCYGRQRQVRERLSSLSLIVIAPHALMSPDFSLGACPPLPSWERVGERGRMPFETSFDYTCALLDARARVRPLDSVKRKCPLSQPSPPRGEGAKLGETSALTFPL